MQRFPLRLMCLATAASMMGGCGAGHRELESLSISPAAATANGVPVQFTATGHWSTSPTTETPMPATWGACTSGPIVDPTTDVTVSSKGVASCGKGVKGTYDVFAWDPQYGGPGAVCNAITACGPGCGRVSATVQLTCP
jgi:hypothetical protein